MGPPLVVCCGHMQIFYVLIPSQILTPCYLGDKDVIFFRLFNNLKSAS